MNLCKTFGEWVRENMKRLDLSNRDVAEMMNLHWTTLGRDFQRDEWTEEKVKLYCSVLKLDVNTGMILAGLRTSEASYMNRVSARENLAKGLQKARQSRKFSPDEVNDSLNFQEGEIQLYEEGLAIPHGVTLNALALLYQCSINTFFGRH